MRDDGRHWSPRSTCKGRELCGASTHPHRGSSAQLAEPSKGLRETRAIIKDKRHLRTHRACRLRYAHLRGSGRGRPTLVHQGIAIACTAQPATSVATSCIVEAATCGLRGVQRTLRSSEWSRLVTATSRLLLLAPRSLRRVPFAAMVISLRTQVFLELHLR